MNDSFEEHEITESGWRILLPSGFERQAEDGSLVFSRLEPRETIFIDVYEAKPDSTARDTFEWLKTTVTPESVLSSHEREDGGVLKLGYYLRERDGESEQTSLHSYSVDPDGGWLVAAFYFDTEESLPWALGAWESISLDSHDRVAPGAK